MNGGSKTIVTAIALILFAAPVAAAPSSPSPAVASPAPSASPTVQSLFEQGQVDAASGRNQAAREELQRALAMDPNNLDVERLLGDVEYRLESYPAAESAYDAVLARVPSDKSVHNRLGGVLVAEGRVDDAIRQFRLSLPLPEGTSNLVDVYTDEGRLPELESEAQLDVDRSPSDDPYSRLFLAKVLDAERKFDESLDLLQQVDNLRPDLVEVHTDLGRVFDEMGRYEDAIAQDKIAINITPTSAEPWMNWGVELSNMGDTSGALEKIDKALQLDSQLALGYGNLGVVYSAMGDFQKAVELYERAISLDPRVPDVYNNLGVDYYEHGLYNLAEAAFVKGLAIHPRDEKLRVDLGYYYQQRGQYAQAIDQYKLALSYDPDNAVAKQQLAEVEAQAGPASGH